MVGKSVCHAGDSFTPVNVKRRPEVEKWGAKIAVPTSMAYFSKG